MNVARLIANEIRETLKRPSRLMNVFRPARLQNYLRFQKLRLVAVESWSREGESVATRRIGSYDRYIDLQRSKLAYLDLSDHEKHFRKVLRERLSIQPGIVQGTRVLCLGARLGAEVAAFRDLGCFAVGIDLNPGKDNPWVLYGDFHNLEFADGCVDVVYSNSLDHCLSLELLLGEVRRVASSAREAS